MARERLQAFVNTLDVTCQIFLRFELFTTDTTGMWLWSKDRLTITVLMALLLMGSHNVIFQVSFLFETFGTIRLMTLVWSTCLVLAHVVFVSSAIECPELDAICIWTFQQF